MPSMRVGHCYLRASERFLDQLRLKGSCHAWPWLAFHERPGNSHWGPKIGTKSVLTDRAISPALPACF